MDLIAMLDDVERLLGVGYAADGQPRKIHSYSADTGALQIPLTNDEARKLDAHWYGEKVADKNYKRLADSATRGER
jgi:hypothetical protein